MNAAMETTGDPDPGTAPDDDPWLPAEAVDGELPEDEAAAAPEPPLEASASPRPRSAAPTVPEAQLALWLASIADQDERALAALYDATFTRVYGLVQRIVRSAAMAEEVVEDTYFQVWRQAVRFDAARGHALTWLLSMARSRAIDALRREGRFQHDELPADEAQEAAGHAPALDELLDLARHQADLHRALLRLGAQPRQLVSLAFFRGLSHEEIAQQTQLPLGTVKSQIRRALMSLRQILGDGKLLALVS